jgi:hypothetical protein
MHLFNIIRVQETKEHLFWLLENTMDRRMYGSLSTASAVSLRASEPLTMMAPPPMLDDPGNVKVVVRCRAFVRRGTCDNQLTSE